MTTRAKSAFDERLSLLTIAGLAALLLMVLRGTALAAEPSLRALDFGPSGVSADGSVVVGNRQGEAIRWTAAGGAIGLGTHAVAGVSADGSVIVGGADRWTAQQGWVPLAGLPAGSNFAARSVSADGSVVVGSSFSGGGGGGPCGPFGDWFCEPEPPSSAALRWSAGAGWTMIGLPSDFENDLANAVSADGSVVVGFSQGEAFRWAAQTGTVGLGFLPSVTQGRASWATAVSADGSVIAGGSGSTRDSDLDRQPFRWTAAEGMVGLDTLPALVTLPTGVSADGSVIIGGGRPTGYSTGGRVGYDSWSPDQSIAVIWDADGNIRTLSNLLVDLGLDVTGWKLHSASAISADGLTIVGSGIDPSGQSVGWIATVPEPATLLWLGLTGLLLSRRRTN